MLEQCKELGEVAVEGCSLAVVQAGARESSAGSWWAASGREQQHALAAMEAKGYHVQLWTPDAGEASTNWRESSGGHENGQEQLGKGGLCSLEKRQPWGT